MVAWRDRRDWVMRLLLGVLICFATSATQAQQPTPPSGAATKRPAPQEIAPKTRDGVQLAGTFYPPAKPGREVVPVILLHGYKGSRADMQSLAEKLQDAGHAALSLDLRGHGGSTKQTMPNGKDREIDPVRLNKADLEGMWRQDVEAAKSFLMEENNKGEVNIDKLCIVGADLGAVVATNWAMLDWSWPPLATGKQGQDVKAVVLLSPPKTVRGLTIMPAIGKREIANKLSWLVVYGEQETNAKDAKAVAGQLEKWLPKPPPEDVKEKQALYILPLPTNLQGAKLLAADNFKVAPQVMTFIERRLTSKSLPWMNRKTMP
jgi:alpha-beta hydrolase superfamily lysophospholipase